MSNDIKLTDGDFVILMENFEKIYSNDEIADKLILTIMGLHFNPNSELFVQLATNLLIDKHAEALTIPKSVLNENEEIDLESAYMEDSKPYFINNWEELYDFLTNVDSEENFIWA